MDQIYFMRICIHISLEKLLNQKIQIRRFTHKQNLITVAPEKYDQFIINLVNKIKKEANNPNIIFYGVDSDDNFYFVEDSLRITIVSKKSRAHRSPLRDEIVLLKLVFFPYYFLTLFNISDFNVQKNLVL